MNTNEFIKDLYKAVDAKNIHHLNETLADNVRFRIGNHPAINGKQPVLEANQSFFASIEAMSHSMDNIWANQGNIICNGRVDYVRLDGSNYSAPFATVLKVQENKITDYLVYADISEL